MELLGKMAWTLGTLSGLIGLLLPTLLCMLPWMTSCFADVSLSHFPPLIFLAPRYILIAGANLAVSLLVLPVCCSLYALLSNLRCNYYCAGSCRNCLTLCSNNSADWDQPFIVCVQGLRPTPIIGAPALLQNFDQWFGFAMYCRIFGWAIPTQHVKSSNCI